LTTYTYASNGGTCSTSCHAKTTPKWGESSTGCNFCHPYDVADWSGSSNRWGGSQISAVNEGFGAHAKHISHIKGLVGIAGSMTLTVPYGSGHAQQVCGSCHPNTIANHIDAANVRTINFGDATYKTGGAAGFSFLFDPAAPGTKPPLYNGSSATSSLTARKTCSNIACHFYETPVWSNY
jgi:hypothetical protein